MRGVRGLTGRRLIYIACFAFLCLIDQRVKTGSGLDGWIETFRGITGIVMGVLVLSHYRPEAFKKRWYLYALWCAISIVGGIVFVLKGQSLHYYQNDRIVLALDYVIWGIIVIQILERLFLEKGLPRFIRRPFFWLWLVMMGCMCAFRNDIHWPAGYLIMFGCFYLTDYAKEERQDLFHGMLEGVIVAFFLMQGWCFVFRPYDAVRYVGVYTNCNQNALFYLIVLAAVMTKLIYTYAGGETSVKAKWIKVWYWMLAGALLGFLFLTISRTGYFTAAILLMAAFVMLWRVLRKQGFFKTMIKSGAILALCFLLLFPAVFGAVRYLPPVFHHPVWFWGEWSEKKVHSWDKWDSEKFVDFDEFFDRAAKRVADILLKSDIGVMRVAAAEMIVETESEGAETLEESVVPHIPARPGGITDLQWERYTEMLAAGYAIDLEQMQNGEENSLLIRSTIYKYYLHKLNLTGYPEEEHGFQMLPYYWVGHAHNIYLQWGLEFGVPVMVLFLILVVWTIADLIRRFRGGKDIRFAGYLLIFLVPCVFGMLEYCWGTGSLTIAMMFVAWGRVMCREE